MKHYIDPATKQIYGYESDGSQDEFIKPGLELIADDYLKAALRLTPERIKGMLSGAVQEHLDAQARALGYDDIRTAVTYADEPAVPTFQKQGMALREWRSHVWMACIGILNAVGDGLVTAPTAADLIASLPVFVAP